MAAKIYDSTQQAFVDAEVPKVNDGNAFVDTEGKSFNGTEWEEDWIATTKWITDITGKYGNRPLITINGQGTYSITSNNTIYMKCPIVNTSYGANTVSPIIGIDNNGKYKSMSFKVSSLTSNNNNNQGSTRACIIFFSVDDKSALTEIASGNNISYDTLIINNFTLNTTITINFDTGVFTNATKPSGWQNYPVNKRYFAFFPSMNSNMNSTDGDYGECTLTDIVFNK